MTNEVTEPQTNQPAVMGTAPLGRGHEEPLDQDDLIIPRVKVVQGTSEEATTEDPNQKVELGTIINSLTKEKMPELFIPIFKFTSWIRWNPRKKEDPNYDPAFDPGQLIFTTNDGNDPRVLEGKDFGPNGEAPAVTKYINYFSFFPGHLMPVITQFAKTSINAGRKIYSMTRFNGDDMFRWKFRLTRHQRENAGTKFYVFDVVAAGKATDEEHAVCAKLFTQFQPRKQDIQVHDTESPGEESWQE